MPGGRAVSKRLLPTRVLSLPSCSATLQHCCACTCPLDLHRAHVNFEMQLSCTSAGTTPQLPQHAQGHKRAQASRHAYEPANTSLCPARSQHPCNEWCCLSLSKSQRYWRARAHAKHLQCSQADRFSTGPYLLCTSMQQHCMPQGGIASGVAERINAAVAVNTTQSRMLCRDKCRQSGHVQQSAEYQGPTTLALNDNAEQAA